MTEIVLKIPEGKNCFDCMFLSTDYMHNMAECNLFNEKLRGRIEYGQLDETSIEKIRKCPINKRNKDE